MKTTSRLLRSGRNLKLGNHKVEIEVDNRGYKTIERFTYFRTCIFKVDYTKEEITIDNGGYRTPSTTRAINSYLNDFEIRHLIEVLKYKVIDLRNK